MMPLAVSGQKFCRFHALSGPTDVHNRAKGAASPSNSGIWHSSSSIEYNGLIEPFFYPVSSRILDG